MANRNMAGGLYVRGNRSLVEISLPGVENMASNGQAIQFADNPQLTNISFPALRSIANCGQLEFSRNAKLRNLNGFGNVSGRLSDNSWGITLDDNPSLQSVAGLYTIEVTNRLVIDNNRSLTTLTGLNISPEIKEFLYIRGNAALTDVSAVASKLVKVGALTLQNNPALTSVTFAQLGEAGGIEVNANNRLTTLGAPKLKTSGSLYVHSSALTSLGLPTLEAVTATEGQFFLSAPKLSSFDMPVLKACAGRFLLENCYALTNLDGFNKLEEIGGYFDIVNSIPDASIKSSLARINGFNALTKVAGYFRILASGDHNGVLTTIKGFQKLTEVGSNFSINNRSLTDASGFGSLIKVEGDFLVNSTGLANLGTFKKMESVGALGLYDNPALTTIGLPALKTLSRNLWVVNNDALQNLDGLEAITAIPDGGNSSIQISDNALLANLNGLQHITRINANLSITRNPKLSNVCGLNKLVTSKGIGGTYDVRDNAYNPTTSDITAGNCADN